MTIEYSEETTFWPVFNILFVLRLHNVENNAHSILIIISNDSLVSVGSVTHNHTIFPDTTFCGFPAGQVDGGRVRRRSVAHQ
mgnify:CR=1 FL=1